MPAYKPYKPIDPEALMKRADFVVELLKLWDEALEIIDRNPSGSVPELGAKAELEAAAYVLRRTYPVHELMDVNSYDYIKRSVDKLALIHDRFTHDCKLINESLVLNDVEKRYAIADREAARNDELLHLDVKDIT